MSEKENLKKLNVGCGGQPLPGFVNLDRMSYQHVDILYDLESGSKMEWFKHGYPSAHEIVPENYFDRILVSHVFEHITNVFGMMTELWRVAKPGCSMVIKCPYGSSDNADEDPTHVRRIFKDSFQYFSQAWYGKNDYGYRADWDYVKRQFDLDGNVFDPSADAEAVGLAVAQLRNVVAEFIVELVAVKPARAPGFAPKDPITRFTFRKPLDVSRILLPKS